MIGFQAGYTGTAGNATTTGSHQTLIGYNTGANTSTQLNYIVCIGDTVLVGASGCVAIGVDHSGNAATTSTQDIIQLGVSAHTVAAFGTSTAQGAAATTPTLGAAAQLANTTRDAMLYIAVGTAGTLTIAIGATSGVATTIVGGLAAAIGDLYTVRLPAGWYIAVTTSTTAAWTATAITC
jgi:hypothetical protein